MKIISFSQQGPRAICIISANGLISNVTLRQPNSSGGTLTYEVSLFIFIVFIYVFIYLLLIITFVQILICTSCCTFDGIDDINIIKIE